MVQSAAPAGERVEGGVSLWVAVAAKTGGGPREMLSATVVIC